MEQRFGLTRKKFLAQFVVHCESHVQNIETVVLVIRVFLMYFFERKKKNLYCRTCIFSLIIVKFLQLHGYMQIAKPHKYCLIRVIIFL